MMMIPVVTEARRAYLLLRSSRMAAKRALPPTIRKRLRPGIVQSLNREPSNWLTGGALTFASSPTPPAKPDSVRKRVKQVRVICRIFIKSFISVLLEDFSYSNDRFIYNKTPPSKEEFLLSGWTGFYYNINKSLILRE
jgi:hypothetical protein